MMIKHYKFRLWPIALCTILSIPMMLPMVWAAPVYSPKPGTKERSAIMDALRIPVTKKVRKKVIFKVGSLQVKDGWAFMQGNAMYANGKEIGDEFLWGEMAALLRKSNGRWRVLHWGFATDISVMDEAKRKYPNAPRAIFPA